MGHELVPEGNTGPFELRTCLYPSIHLEMKKLLRTKLSPYNLSPGFNSNIAASTEEMQTIFPV